MIFRFPGFHKYCFQMLVNNLYVEGLKKHKGENQSHCNQRQQQLSGNRSLGLALETGIQISRACVFTCFIKSLELNLVTEERKQVFDVYNPPSEPIFLHSPDYKFQREDCIGDSGHEY